MNALKLLVITLNVIYAVNANINCDSFGVSFYEEIGCIPTTTRCNQCPKYYTCPQHPPSHDYCVLGSKLFKNGEQVPDSDHCNFCNCYIDTDNPKSKGAITCGAYDCFSPLVPKENCTQARDLNSCCGGIEICPSPDNQICKVGNQTYQEGDVFNPPGTCWTCSCQKGFQEGVYGEPNCVRQSCSLAMMFQEQIKGRCSPVYTNDGDRPLCCPSAFVCPDNIKNLKVKPSRQTGDSKTCVLGDLKVKYNEAIDVTYESWDGIKNATCTCSLPPYLTCIN